MTVHWAEGVDSKGVCNILLYSNLKLNLVLQCWLWRYNIQVLLVWYSSQPVIYRRLEWRPYIRRIRRTNQGWIFIFSFGGGGGKISGRCKSLLWQEPGEITQQGQGNFFTKLFSRLHLRPSYLVELSKYQKQKYQTDKSLYPLFYPKSSYFPLKTITPFSLLLFSGVQKLSGGMPNAFGGCKIFWGCTPPASPRKSIQGSN